MGFLYSHLKANTNPCASLSLYTSGRGHGKKFPMFCASCLPGGLIQTLGTFSHGSLYFGWSVFNGGCHLQYGMTFTHATYFPFVYCYHIFLLSFRRNKVMARVVFCLACCDARRGVVQITHRLHCRFLSLPQCCMLPVVASVIKWCIDRWKENVVCNLHTMIVNQKLRGVGCLFSTNSLVVVMQEVIDDSISEVLKPPGSWCPS